MNLQVPVPFTEFLNQVPIVGVFLPLFDRTRDGDQLDMNGLLIEEGEKLHNIVGRDERVDITNVNLADVLEGRNDFGEFF